jgi:hypothetical protein
LRGVGIPSATTSTVFACEVGGRRRSTGGEPFGEAEPERQLLVVARRAHRHRDRLPVDADLEGLFHGDCIPLPDGTRQADDFDLSGGIGRRLAHGG